MSTYLNEVADAERERGEKDQEKATWLETQHTMAEQVIEIAKVLQAADAEDEREALGAYMDAAASVIQTQNLGLGLLRLNYTLRDILRAKAARR